MAERKPPGHPLGAASSLCSEIVTISAQWPQTPTSALNLPSSWSCGPGGRLFPGYRSKFSPHSIILALTTSSQVPTSSVSVRGSRRPLFLRGSPTMISSSGTDIKEGPGDVRHMNSRAGTVDQFRCVQIGHLFSGSPAAACRRPPATKFEDLRPKPKTLARPRYKFKL